ncbi:MAG: PaaI family thioesterase [Anaerolineales bacterium]|jgi:uncharacterized protein (TIGR00369 family)
METKDPTSIELTSLAKQPNSRNCFGCGVQNPHGLALAFYEYGAQQVVADYTVPEKFEGYPGVAHGGIIASMLDEAVGRAVMVGKHYHFMVTAKLIVRYRKPVPVGQRLRLVGRLTRRRGRMATAISELYLQDGTLAAEAEATMIEVSHAPDAVGEMDTLGWKVYPD